MTAYQVGKLQARAARQAFFVYHKVLAVGIAVGVLGRNAGSSGIGGRSIVATLLHHFLGSISMTSPLNVVQLTPVGRGAVATLLVSGCGAVEAASAQVCTRRAVSLHRIETDQLVLGRCGVGSGEDVVVRRRDEQSIEIHCHGGQAAVAQIEQGLVQQGAGSLSWQDWVDKQQEDPIVAAARRSLAEARTERTAAILLDQHQGALRRAFREIEAAIDRGERMTASRLIDTLLARADLGRHLGQPWRVVLAGHPNVGKSSLFNALLGYSRAIIHPTSGTTRDVVTATTAVDGWPIELCDTAGLGATSDPVERAGIERARQQLAEADLLVLVFDASDAWTDADQSLVKQWPDAVVIHNKCDLAAPAVHLSGLRVSASKQEGIDGVVEVLARRLVPTPPERGAAVPFTAQQVSYLESLRQVVQSGLPR